MYPIKFENLYFHRVWGGRDFGTFRNNLPQGKIGESWDIACHKNGTSVVANGAWKGKTFSEILKEYTYKLIGTKVSKDNFPLLVKLINSREKLSVQVHPNDEYAQKHEKESGKTEAWYVIEAKPAAKLIVGTKNCDKAIFSKAVTEGKTMDFLNIIDVKKGDCFLIYSGLVHAICEGITIAEIQQNSDITYRVYDYGRPREIHVEKSLDVINFDLHCQNLSKNKVYEFGGFKKVDLCENEFFGLRKYSITCELKDKSDEERFATLTCVEGSGVIVGHGFKEAIAKGDSVFIPATLGEYEVIGELEILKSYPS